MAEEFETWLHQLNEAFVASTTASLDVEEALIIVKRRATTDLKHDGGPNPVLKEVAHHDTEQPLDPVPPVTNRDHDADGATTSAADLLRRVTDGDPAAWDEVVRRYHKLVSATVRSFRLQDADALDAVQMTWLRLAENTHRVLWPEQLGSWLVTTARHECLRILRHARPAPNPIETVADTIADPSVSPEPQAINADAARTLWSLVEELSPRQRTLLRELFFTDNPCSYAEIARVAGIPTGTIGPTRARALRQLRQRIEGSQPHRHDVAHPDGTRHTHVDQDDCHESPGLPAPPALVGLEATVDDDGLRRQRRLLACALAITA